MYTSIPDQLKSLGNSSMSNPKGADLKELKEALTFIDSVDSGRNNYIKRIRFAKSYISVGMKKVSKILKEKE